MEQMILMDETDISLKFKDDARFKVGNYMLQTIVVGWVVVSIVFNVHPYLGKMIQFD